MNSDIVLIDSDSDEGLKRRNSDADGALLQLYKRYHTSDEQIATEENGNDAVSGLSLNEMVGEELNVKESTNGSSSPVNDDIKLKGNRVEFDTSSELDSMEEAFDARDFLRTFGRDEFIRNFLPQNTAAPDIIRAIEILGFKVDPSIDTSDMYQLINYLREIFVRVMKNRIPLDDFYSIDHVLEKIKSSNNIIVITGAGISTSLGIPDFRSSKGLYSQLTSLGLSDPQEVFDIELFHTDPKIFYSIAHKILPPKDVYTPLHSFIRILESKNKLLRNYTQNIDNVEQNAGISASKIVQCHGSFATASCVTCKYKVDGEKIRKDIELKQPAFCPKCSKQRKKLEKSDNYYPESYGVFKPDITFFGEGLPSRFHDLINEDLQQCDLLISIGTSLQVAPVANIVEKIPAKIPQVLINRDPIPRCNFDVSILGFCDDAAVYLCKELSWELDHVKFEEILKGGISLNCLNEYEGTYRVINDSRPPPGSISDSQSQSDEDNDESDED